MVAVPWIDQTNQARLFFEPFARKAHPEAQTSARRRPDAKASSQADRPNASPPPAGAG